MSGIGLTDGPVSVLFPLLGAAALLWLLICSSPHYLYRWVPLALAAGVLSGVILKVLLDDVINLWGAPLDWRVYFYCGLSVTALFLVVPRWFQSRRWRTRLLSPLAAVAVLVVMALQVNQIFGYYPTVGSLWGEGGFAITQKVPEQAAKATLSPETPLTRLAEWEAPSDMPSEGKVVETVIPGTVSRVPSGKSYLYVPPAMLTSELVNLPVLVLIHGNPGGSMDWLRSGIVQQLNAYAAKNKGLAPLVVMPDVSGNYAQDWPLCMDSRLSAGGSYLSVDVPNFVRSTFALGQRPGSLAIGGFSYGGTCSLQAAVTSPEVYPIFLDIAGDQEPTAGKDRAALINKYFNGDAQAFAAVNPLDQLKTKRLPGSRGIVVVGGNDDGFRPKGEAVYQALQAAGVNVQLQVIPGGHSWKVWGPGLSKNLDWLMGEFGVT